MKYQVIAPYLHEPFFKECMKDCKIPKENITVVDNTRHNIGLVRSWNIGVEAMYRNDADWLIHLSSAIRFGPPGGLDFIDTLKIHSGHYIIHAATLNVRGGEQQTGHGGKNGIYGWHLTAFKREVFDNIGRFDENFNDYGPDDIDLSVRVQKHYKGKPGWDTFPVDVTDTVMGHGVKFAESKVKADPHAQQEYFKRKWGVWADENIDNYYDRPFNDKTKELSYWPKPPDPRALKEAHWVL